MKVIKSLENRGILLKVTTKKIISKEGGHLTFLRPLMTLMLTLGLSAGMSPGDADIQKKILGSGTKALTI